MRRTVAGLCEQLPGKSRVENGFGDRVRDTRLPPRTGRNHMPDFPLSARKPLAPDPSSRQLFANYLKAKPNHQVGAERGRSATDMPRGTKRS